MCIFCQIANKDVPAELLYEDEEIVAFRDIHPIAPVHVVVIPKRHIASINDLEDGDARLIGRMVLAARKIAQDLAIAEKGYKLLFRTGKDGGQEVGHIHLHLLGGAPLYEEIRAA